MALLQKESKHGETVVQKGNEGLLYVTLVDKHTAEEKSGTVCDTVTHSTCGQLDSFVRKWDTLLMKVLGGNIPTSDTFLSTFFSGK